MPTYNLPPQIIPQYGDNNGDPLAGGLLYTYAAGTTTPQTTYQTQSGTANANPIVLDAYGRCDMWLDPSLSYKFVLKTSAGVTIRTVDNVVGLLAPSAVNTASIADGAVTADKVATGAVTGAAGGGKLAASAINGQTAETVPAVGDEILIYDLSATALRKMTKSNWGKLSSRSAAVTDTILATDDVVIYSGASFTGTLPTAVGLGGKILRFIHNDSTLGRVYTIDGNGAETVGGVASRKIATIGEQLTIMSDNTNWMVLDHYIPSAFVAYTPTGTWSTNSTYTGFWQRVGDSIFMQVHIALAGAPTSATLAVNLPSGLTIDTAKLTSIATNGALPGNGSAQDEGTAQFPLYPHYSSTTAVQVNCLNHAGATYTVGNAVTQAVPFTFGNTDTLRIKIGPLPIVDWEG